MKLLTVLNTLEELLSEDADAESAFWSKQSLINAINEAALNIVRIRKDTGVKQIKINPTNPINLPDGTQALITLESVEYKGKTYNPKQISKKTLDETTPNWTQETGAPEFYIYELDTPTEILFYPKLEGTATCKISQLPGEISIVDTENFIIDGVATTLENAEIQLDDGYRPDLINYAMFRLLSKQGKSNGEGYYQLFSSSFGLKSESDKIYEEQEREI